MTTPEPTLTDEEKRQLTLLTTLPQNEAFVVWRDMFCKPVVTQIRAKLKHPAELSDIDLRATVMHLNSLEGLFDDIFDQAKFLTREE